MRSAPPAGTPKLASLKYLGMSADCSPGTARLSPSYIGSWSQQCGTVAPVARNAASSGSEERPRVPDGRTLRKPPPSSAWYAPGATVGAGGGRGSGGSWAAAGAARARSSVAARPAIFTAAPIPRIPEGQSWTMSARLREGRDAVGLGDRRDLLGGAVELLVRQDRRSLERQVTRDLQPRAAPVVVVANAHRHRARDPVRAQQQHVERMPALPREALLRVVGRPHVERRQRVERAPVGDRPRAGDLGPGTDAYAIRLRDAAVHRDRAARRLAVRPHALLQRPPELRVMGLAHQIVALVIERGVEEEAVVLELEVPVRLANSAFAERQQLLALRKSAHGDSPFLESDRHRGGGRMS